MQSRNSDGRSQRRLVELHCQRSHDDNVSLTEKHRRSMTESDELNEKII